MAWADGKPLRHDALLTSFAIRAFNTGQDMFIGDQIFPEINVENQSDKYAVIMPDGFFREHDTKRAPRGRARMVSFDVSSDSYYAENHALGADYPLETLTNAARAFQIRENHTNLVISGLKLAQEIRIANIVSSGSNSGSFSSLTGSQQWSVVASADIQGHVSSAHAAIRMATGFIPNTAVIDYDTLAAVRRNARLLELYKFTRAGELPDDLVRRDIFKVDRMLVGKGVKNTSPPGVAASNTNVWNKICWFGYVAPVASGTQVATFGARMRWRPADMPSDLVVKRDRFDKAGEPSIEVLEAKYWQDEKVVAKNLGYAITNTLA